MRWIAHFLAWITTGIAAQAVEAPPGEVWAFFERHCLECHDDLSKKGGLDLTTVGFALEGQSQLDLWTRLHDRVARGEMPPAKKPAPLPAEAASLTDWLAPRLTKADLARREVVLRRLNREEWQHTVHDLLGIEIELKDLLPADQQAGGFDNNGEALAISAELMSRYVEAARRAIDAALVTGPRPEERTFTADSLHEVQRYIDDGGFGYVDGRVVVYLANKTDYSKISTRARRTPEPGRYRFRFTAATHRAAAPILFNVVASDFNQVGAVYRDLGHYEAGAEPREHTIEATLGKGFAIQFFAHGLPEWVKEPARAQVPGVGFSAVEITGPLNETWPPTSHTRLMGDASLESGSLADAEAVLKRFLPRAFRRPVSDEEVARYRRLIESRLDAGQTFDESLRVGLAAVLCSPSFLFLREDSRPSAGKLAGPEIAARLSYFLWSSLPDESLIQAAAAGHLATPERRSAEAERLLADPKLERFVRHFTGQWLKLREIDATTPDTKLYKGFDEWLKVSMVRETQGFFRHVLTNNLGIENFLGSDFAVLNRRLAEHYQLPVDGVPWLEPAVVPLPPGSPRGGVLTQGAVLKVTANGTNTSPVIRGVWVAENILGRRIPPPPPNIAGIEPDIRSATTIREQLDLHREAESCKGCHQYFDPPGFALESFDPVGGWREFYRRFQVNEQHADKGWGSVVNGKPVDASGELSTGEAFGGFPAFQRLLLEDSTAFAHCLTEKLLTYALGREMGFADRPEIDRIAARAKASGNGFKTLIQEVAASELFIHP